MAAPKSNRRYSRPLRPEAARSPRHAARWPRVASRCACKHRPNPGGSSTQNHSVRATGARGSPRARLSAGVVPSATCSRASVNSAVRRKNAQVCAAQRNFNAEPPTSNSERCPSFPRSSTATNGVRLWLLDDHWGGPRSSGHAAKIFAQLERTAEARHSTSKETFANSVRGV